MMDFPWFQFYPEAVPKQIDPEEYSSAVDLFEESIKNMEMQLLTNAWIKPSHSMNWINCLQLLLLSYSMSLN